MKEVTLIVSREGPSVHQVSVVAMDLDNTLYDWVDMWYRAFSAMLETLVAESGLPRETLLADIQSVYRKHGTSEYAFLVKEIESLSDLHSGQDVVQLYEKALSAYRAAQQAALRLYPCVKETLRALKESGCLLVVFTESMASYTAARVRQLELDGLVDYLYAPPDHPLPPDATREEIGHLTAEHDELKETEQRFVPPGTHKPAPDVLLQILHEVEAPIEQSVYVGDNLYKDVLMAQDAGVTDVHAAYGVAQHSEAYALLRRVSHWTDEMIERDRQLHERASVQPTHVLEESFAQLLDKFQFARFGCKVR